MLDFDPNAPAFGSQAQKPEDLVEQTKVAEPEVKAVAETKEEDKVEEISEEESKVPYSRFKKFHDQAKQAQAETDSLRAEAEEWKRKANANESKEESENNLPFTVDEWVELYGDNEITRKAYQKQAQMSNALFEQAKHEGAKAYREEAQSEQVRVKQNLESIDSNLEALDEFAGHKLSEAEQSAILDIVDEYSSKDADGNYVSNIPYEKAYGIYELKQQAAKAPQKESRNKVASLTNTKTQGAPSDDQAERDKNFNPLDWGAALRRLNK